MAACCVCTETCSPPRVGACLTMAWQRRRAARRIYGMATALRQRGFVCTRWAVVRVQQSANPCAPYINPARTRATAWSCFAAVGLCRTDTSDGVRRGGAPRWPRRPPAPAAAKTSRPIHQTMAWGRVGGRGAPRPDLRYQRKQARVVRRADLAFVRAGAVGGHACVHVWLSALVQAVVGAPVGGVAAQNPPVPLPVGAVLGVFFVPVGVRGMPSPQA